MCAHAHAVCHHRMAVPTAIAQARVLVTYNLLGRVHVSTHNLSLPHRWGIVMTESAFCPKFVNKVHLAGPTYTKHFAAEMARNWVAAHEAAGILHNGTVVIQTNDKK